MPARGPCERKTGVRRFIAWAFLAACLLDAGPSAAGAPSLTITASTNRLVIAWPADAGDYVLETTDRLGPGSVWWPARIAVRFEAADRTVWVPLGGPGRFFRLATNDYTSWIETATGPVDSSGIGVMLPHEHIFTDLRGPTVPGYGEADPEVVVELMRPSLVEARLQGIEVLVECTSIGVGRNVPVLRRLAEESGLRIVVPTGVYGRGIYAPPAHRAMSEDELMALFRDEIREGIEGTGVKAGFIKIATGGGSLTALEEKFLRAAGRAAQETGAVIASHTTYGTAAKRQWDILESIGPAIRFIWVHAQAETNRRWHRDLAARGAFIEFDSLGWNPAEDTSLITAIQDLVSLGYADRVLLSHDAGWYDPAKPGAGPQKPYTYLLGTFVPKLRSRGWNEETIRWLTRDNPERAFSFMARRNAVGFRKVVLP